jgi:hypothetical protein
VEESRPHPALFAFVSVLAAGAVLALAASWSVFPVDPSPTLLVLAVLAVLAELATLTGFRGGDVATSYPLTVAAMVLFGPTAAAVVGILVVVAAELWRRDPARLKGVFNTAQSALADLAAAWTYVLLGGPVVAAGRSSSGLQAAFDHWPQFLLPVLVASVVAVGVNVALVVVVLWLSRGVSPATSLRGFGLGVFTAIHLTLGLVGVAVALIVVTSNWIGLLVFAFPLVTARQILQNSARLQHEYANTVRVLVRSIEAKDEYTRGHSERVADYAVRFCSHLGLSDAQTERIQFAAMLHDLGKMGVRAEVLNKPARLSDAEYAEMQRHPAEALPIVAKIPRTEDLLPIIRHHHERIDGCGYPDGIEGDRIPYASRLLAVCDTYDAMTSSRPYRPALSRAKAVDELESAAGTQLDGELAAAFLDMLDDESGESQQ